MTIFATSVAIDGDYRVNKGGNKSSRSIERKLIMILISDCVVDRYGRAEFSLRFLSERSHIPMEIIHAELGSLKSDGIITDFDEMTYDGWQDRIYEITVPSFSETQGGRS